MNCDGKIKLKKAPSLMLKLIGLFDNKTKSLIPMLDKYVPEFPKEVKLELPKLKKVGQSETPKMKLPKLKKV